MGIVLCVWMHLVGIVPRVGYAMWEIILVWDTLSGNCSMCGLQDTLSGNWLMRGIRCVGMIGYY